MFKYSAFSLTIDSELELTEFGPGTGEPHVRFRLGKIAGPLRPASISEEFVFPIGVGRFHILGGREIIIDPAPESDPTMIRAMLQGRLIAYLLRQRGRFPLHCSGVLSGGGSLLFAGESGAGKSTTAAAFHQRGYRIFTDDIAALQVCDGGLLAAASWTGLRLSSESQTVMPPIAPSGFSDGKHIFRLEGDQPAPAVAVHRIYFLEYGPTPRPYIEKVPLPLSASLLHSNSFVRHWRADAELIRINLNRSAAIAEFLRVRRIFRPRSFSALNAVVDLVEEDIANG